MLKTINSMIELIEAHNKEGIDFKKKMTAIYLSAVLEEAFENDNKDIQSVVEDLSNRYK